MSEDYVHKVQAGWKKNALIDNETYKKWYASPGRTANSYILEIPTVSKGCKFCGGRDIL